MALPDYNILLQQGVDAYKKEYPEANIPQPSLSGKPYTSKRQQIPDMQSLQQFKASFTSDPAKSSNFNVLISIPQLFLNSSNQGLPSIERLTLRCDSASLPGRTLQTQDLKIYGPIEKLPYLTSYEDITFSFICSSSMLEKNLFDFWLEYINPSDTWDFKFRNNYCSRIIITQYDSTKRASHQVELIDAFPISVSPLQLNWSDEGFHKLEVTFAYTYWAHVSDYVPENTSLVYPNSSSYIENLGKIVSGISIARDIAHNLGKDNKYAILSAIGAASSLLNLNSVGNRDTYNDNRTPISSTLKGGYISDVTNINDY